MAALTDMLRVQGWQRETIEDTGRHIADTRKFWLPDIATKYANIIIH